MRIRTDGDYASQRDAIERAVTFEVDTEIAVATD